MVLGIGYSPAKIIFGKRAYFSSISDDRLQLSDQLTGEEIVRQNHLILTLEALCAIMTSDANQTVDRCLDKTLRIGAAQEIEMGSPAQIAMKDKWCSGWRYLGRIHSNCMVGNDREIRKDPFLSVRRSESRNEDIPAETMPLPSVDDMSESSAPPSVVAMNPGALSEASCGSALFAEVTDECREVFLRSIYHSMVTGDGNRSSFRMFRGGMIWSSVGKSLRRRSSM